jgi:GNAT superfamily N-acetyltransferase
VTAVEIHSVSGLDGLRRWAAVRNVVHPHDPDDAEQMVLVRAAEPDHVNLIAYVDGAAAGVGLLSGDPLTRDSDEQYVEVAVVPEARGRGVGSALFRQLSQQARALGKSSLLCTATAGDATSTAFLARHSFVEIERMEMWTLDLSGELPTTPPPPEGVELASLLERPAALASMYDVACATAPELGGHLARQAESLHDWHAYELGGSLVLDLTVVAAEGEDVVGFSTLRRVGEGERVEVRTLRVLSEWRRRGIARALVLTQAHGARAQGAATMQMLLRTTAAVRLAADLGFRPESVSVDYRGPLFDDA